MHAVEIDHDQINATFDQYAENVETLQGEHIAAGDETGPHRSAWEKPARLAARFLAHQVAPNWNISEQDQDEWAAALAQCADQLMPGGMGNVESWGPWGKLLFASVNVALCGLDFETLSIRPLRAPESEPGTTDAEPPPAAAGGRYTVGD